MNITNYQYFTMKYIFLNILILLTILGCSRNDLQLKDESNLTDIELLKADFQSDSIAFSKSENRSKLNYRQSLQRIVYWEYATKKGKSTYIPIQQYLPKGSITTTGQNFLPHRAWLVIERDSIAKSNSYKILTLISDKSVVHYTNFEGISLLEDYFTGTRIDAIKYGVDENPISQEKRAKLYALGGWGSVCSPDPNSSMRCGPNLSCEYIKIATVCPGMTDTYCAPRYEWNCVRRLGPIDPDNPDPTGPPDTWPDLPGGGGGGNGGPPYTFNIVDSGPKVDPKKENECFDTFQSAVLTIYVQQGKEGTRDLVGPNEVGHVFVGIKQGNIERYYGFYPKGGANSAMVAVGTDYTSEIRDNSETMYHVSISKTVSALQMSNIIAYANSPVGTYNVNNYACTDFGIAIGKMGGINLPSTKSTNLIFSGTSPGNLGEDIRNTNFPNTTKTTTKSVSPKRKGNC